jgi:hypothetical protein
MITNSIQSKIKHMAMRNNSPHENIHNLESLTVRRFQLHYLPSLDINLYLHDALKIISRYRKEDMHPVTIWIYHRS